MKRLLLVLLMLVSVGVFMACGAENVEQEENQQMEEIQVEEDNQQTVNEEETLNNDEGTSDYINLAI